MLTQTHSLPWAQGETAKVVLPLAEYEELKSKAAKADKKLPHTTFIKAERGDWVTEKGVEVSTKSAAVSKLAELQAELQESHATEVQLLNEQIYKRDGVVKELKAQSYYVKQQKKQLIAGVVVAYVVAALAVIIKTI